MRTRALIHFSWKNLWAHRMRAILTIGGVTIGMSAIVFLVSLGFGLEQLVTSQIANFEAFTLIDVPSANPPSGKINQQALDKVSTVPHIDVIERVVDLAGRVRVSDQNSTTETVVVGARPSYFPLADLRLSAGAMFETESADQAVVNVALVALLGYSATNPAEAIGKTITLDLILPQSLREKDDVDGPLVKEGLTLKIVGIFPETQSPSLFISQVLAEKQGIVNFTAMKIKIDNRDNVATVRKQIENVGFATEYIGDTVNQITQFFAVFRIVLGGFGAIALIVAALGTFNTLTISLIERIREVSLLKMLGMRRYDVFRLFIIESLTIGVLGGVCGSTLGLGVGYVGNKVVTYLATRSGSEAVSIFYTPPIFIAIIVGGSIIIGVLTGFYPAFRAIKTNPLDALRYE